MTHTGLSPRLQTARDLLVKLTKDADRIQNDTWDTYAAFDFFVTAEHMGEWPPLRAVVGLKHGIATRRMRRACLRSYATSPPERSTSSRATAD